MLGSVKGKRVMELGAGIGRFTGDLGAQAKSVLALDFMQRLIEENERKHGHMGNITFRAGDACELQAEPESCEVVFTNWLLMYLGKFFDLCCCLLLVAHANQCKLHVTVGFL